LKAYFNYVVITLCGIPSITLTSNEDDWNSIITKSRQLAQFDCQDWSNSLVSVLSYFAHAFTGYANPNFWSNIYKVNGPHGSGGTNITGWINTFFPYLNNQRTPGTYDIPNPLASYPNSHHYGIPPDQFPTGLSSTPFTWDYYGTPIPMTFLAGFIGASQNPTTLQVSTIQAWGVAPHQPQ
jgi:hypothetical protein